MTRTDEQEVLFQGANDLRSHPFLINGIARMVAFAQQCGVSAEVALEGTGIKTEELHLPHRLVTAEQEFRVVHSLLQQLDAPGLGLRVGQCFRLSVVGLLGTTVPHCATVGDAMQFFMAHIGLSYTHFQVQVCRQHDDLSLVFVEQYPLGELYRFFLERDLVFTLQAFRDVAGAATERLLHTVEWPFPEQGDRALVEGAFRCDVRFDAPRAAIVGSASALAMPLPQADRITLALLAEQCERLEQSLTVQHPLRDRLWTLLLEESPLPTMEALAQGLAMTARTLRRKLNDEQVTFRTLRQAAMEARAMSLLREAHPPLVDIAETLGYGDLSAFVQAFRKGTGMTPARYRRQWQAKAAGSAS